MIARASVLSSPARALTLRIDGSAAASRAEHVELAGDRIQATRMRSRLCLDGLDVLEPGAVEAADDTRVADRDVQPLQVAVVHDDVRSTGKRQAPKHLAAIAVEHDQL